MRPISTTNGVDICQTIQTRFAFFWEKVLSVRGTNLKNVASWRHDCHTNARKNEKIAKCEKMGAKFVLTPSAI